MFGRNTQTGEGVGAGPTKIMCLGSGGTDPDNGPQGLLLVQGAREQAGLKTECGGCVEIACGAHFVQTGLQAEGP